MGDNITLPAATKVIRTKDRTNIETQITAIDLNPAGAEALMAGFMPTAQGVDLHSGGTLLTTKFASASIGLSGGGGSGTLVAAVTGKHVRVLSFALVPSAGTLVIGWQSAGTALSGLMPITANSVHTMSAPLGLLQTAVTEHLILTLGGAGTVTGHLSYVEVP